MMMEPIPNMNKVFSLLSQQERQAHVECVDPQMVVNVVDMVHKLQGEEDPEGEVEVAQGVALEDVVSPTKCVPYVSKQAKQANWLIPTL